MVCCYYIYIVDVYTVFSSASSGDYTPITSPIELRYRGGRRRETEMSFTVTILGDSDDNEPTEEFYISVTSVRTVSVLTPRITVRILGSGL